MQIDMNFKVAPNEEEQVSFYLSAAYAQSYCANP